MMKLFTKGQVIRVSEYENARYVYTVCGTNIITFRIYKTLKDGSENPIYSATTGTIMTLTDYIFEFTHYTNRETGKEYYTLLNIHTGGIHIDKI